MELNECGHLATSVKSLQNLLKDVKRTHNNYLSTISQKQNSNSSDCKQMKNDILKCTTHYHSITNTWLKIATTNNNTYSLNYKMNDVKRIVENKLINIKLNKNTRLLLAIILVKIYQQLKLRKFQNQNIFFVHLI